MNHQLLKMFDLLSIEQTLFINLAFYKPMIKNQKF